MSKTQRFMKRQDLKPYGRATVDCGVFQLDSSRRGNRGRAGETSSDGSANGRRRVCRYEFDWTDFWLLQAKTEQGNLSVCNEPVKLEFV